MMREGFELLRTPPDDPWWRAAVPALDLVEGDRVPPPYVGAFRMTLPVIDMSVYLPWLFRRFTESGGRFVERRIVALDRAAVGAVGLDRGTLDAGALDHALVFNCAGFGAGALCGDASLTPVRGQIVVVKNPGLETFYLDETHPDGITYIVPRAHDCVLGGTAEVGVDDLRPDAGTADAIVDRCSAIEPRLRDATVVAHRVGLRPSRPQVRVEVQELPSGTRCVHNYGHGGAGVTLSWGCAETAVRAALGDD